MRRVVVQVDALHQQASSPALASGGKARRANGPWAQRPALAVADDEPRLDVVARREREQSRRVESSGSGSASAPRTSSGFFCQCRRMKAAGARPPSRAVGRSMSMSHCAMIVRCRSAPLASSP